MEYERSGLGVLVTTLLVGVTACSNGEHQDYIEGTVVGEFGSVHNQVENNSQIRNDSTEQKSYGLKVRTDSARYVLEITSSIQDYKGNLIHNHTPRDRGRTLLGLAASIEPGTKIKFPTKYVGENKQIKLFGKDKIGIVANKTLDIIRYAHERNDEKEFATPD